MDRKRQLKNDIAEITEQIQQLDNSIVMLREKLDKIKLDPFGARKGKVQSEIEEKEAERDLLQKKLDDLNQEYSDILKEEHRIKDNKRFFKGDGKKQTIKGVIIGAVSVIVIFALAMFGIRLYKNQQINARKIIIGYNSEHVIGMDYETVVAKLKERGFTNVSPQIMEDIESYDDANRVGVITEVSVNGESIFSPTDKFFPEDEIIITYHTLTAKAIADREAAIKAEEEARILAENEKEAAFRKEEEERERKKAEEKAKEEEKKKAKEEAVAEEKAKTEQAQINPKTITEEKNVVTPVTPKTNPIPTSETSTSTVNETADAYEWTVYKTKSGDCYHQDPNCGGKSSEAITLEQAKKLGLRPCKKCAQ